jgi:hypothetical protein
MAILTGKFHTIEFAICDWDELLAFITTRLDAADKVRLAVAE